MASPADSSCWRFEALVDDIAEPLTTTHVPSPSTHTSRILLVETNTPPSQHRQQQQRLERLTLQEVAHSPTYYDTASLSYQTSYASTQSAASRPPSFSPPPSPAVTTTMPHRPSWTASMESTKDPFPPFVVDSDSIPLGWLRPSLSPTALLDINQSTTPSHFVFLGFGNTELLTALFGLKGTWDSDTLCERSFFFNVDDEQKAMATLVTPGNDTSYLENLMLNRIGITSILVTLPANATV
ncbi:hypothetical protein [Absidia glauca]|uniref:Uncharacterized protein n=1 Tax=Absidia glauca TaxID=4829 RepID=A0A163JYW3_ABSGL|nr:hypothetical protein [Absidia glauca]